jgi:hypothetical protein
MDYKGKIQAAMKKEKRHCESKMKTFKPESYVYRCSQSRIHLLNKLLKIE